MIKAVGDIPPPTYGNVYSKWKMPRLQRGCASSNLVILTTHRTWYLQQKATHLLGGFLRSLGGRRGSDFCEKLTFRENFSQKNFLKKFSNFPENRLTTARKCGII